jgi:hypothetical protein
MKSGIKGLLILVTLVGLSYALLEVGKERGRKESYRNCITHYNYLRPENAVSKCDAVVYDKSFVVEYENIPD